MFKVIALLLQLLNPISPAHAEGLPNPDPATCESGHSYFEVRDQNAPDGWVDRELTPLEKSNFEEAYNAIPPESDYHWDHIFVALNPTHPELSADDGSPVAIIIYVDNKGCMLHFTGIGKAELDKMIGGHSA